MAKITGTKYEMEYQPLKRMFLLKVWGFYSPDDAMAFITAYNSETRKFKAENTSFVIDCDGLITSKPESKAMLVECMKLYMALPYKNRIFIKSSSATCNLWVKSAMKDGGMIFGKDGFILDDMTAVLEYIK